VTTIFKVGVKTVEEALKGSWVEKKISKIQAMTVNELQYEVNKNLSKLPKKYRLAFVFVLNKKWDEIVATYGSLGDKSYQELKKLRKQLSTLGDLSGSDIREIVGISLVNEMVYNDPKVEIYLIKRLTNTRLASGLIDRIRSVFTP
jgi:hypothetical protein